MTKEEKDAMFWDLAQPMLIAQEAEKSTMMGFPCLRTQGQFFASLEKDTGDLIVKLPKEQVAAMIDAGEAIPFAPAGRTFREWARIPEVDEKKWTSLLQEARAFVLTKVK